MNLELSEGRVFGARYLTVHPVPQWDSVQYWGDWSWAQMVEWCVETFGPTPKDGVWTPSCRWYVNNARFWFRNKEDLMLFVLRWS